jgi:hypothetical protein
MKSLAKTIAVMPNYETASVVEPPRNNITNDVILSKLLMRVETTERLLGEVVCRSLVSLPRKASPSAGTSRWGRQDVILCLLAGYLFCVALGVTLLLLKPTNTLGDEPVERESETVITPEGRVSKFQLSVSRLEKSVDGLNKKLVRSQMSFMTPAHSMPIKSAIPAEASVVLRPLTRHFHDPAFYIKLPSNAEQHIDAAGRPDYWIVQSLNTDRKKRSRVLPFGSNSVGVFVHDLDDGSDYILTPSGGSITLPEPSFDSGSPDEIQH